MTEMKYQQMIPALDLVDHKFMVEELMHKQTTALAKSLLEHIELDKSYLFRISREMLNVVNLDAVKIQGSMHVDEIVHCEDCIYHRTVMRMYGNYQMMLDYCEYDTNKPRMVKDKDYCSWGERSKT